MCLRPVFWACELWVTGVHLIGAGCHQRLFVTLLSKGRRLLFCSDSGLSWLCQGPGQSQRRLGLLGGLVGWQIKYLEITHLSHSIPFLSREVYHFPIILSYLVVFLCLGVVAIFMVELTRFLQLLASTLAAPPSWHLSFFTAPVFFRRSFHYRVVSCTLFFSAYICIFSYWNLIFNVTVCTLLFLVFASPPNLVSSADLVSSEPVSGLASQWILVSRSLELIFFFLVEWLTQTHFN